MTSATGASGPRPPPRPSILRSLGTLGLGTIATAVLGLALQSLIGFYFGASIGTDAYFMSLSIVAFLSKAFMFSHFKSIGLPEYLRLRERDPMEARRLLGSMLRYAIVAMGFLCLVVWAAAPFLVAVLAPGYEGEQRELTVRLLKIRAPALFFLGTTAVALVALETRGRFGAAITANKVLPASVAVVLLAVFGTRFGLVGLAWMGMTGAVAGGTIMLVLAFRSAAAGAVDQQILRRIGRAWAKFGWSNVATSGAEWIYRIAASSLAPGLFSAVVYGRMVQDMLHGALNDAAQRVALPQFTRAAEPAQGEVSGGDAGPDLSTALGVSLEGVTVVALPIALFVACFADRITALLFGRGAFLSEGMLGPTATAMALFMVGFVVQGRNQLCFQAAFAAGHSHVVNRVQVLGHVYRAVVLIPMVYQWSFVGLVGAQVSMNLFVAVAFWAIAPAELCVGGRIRGGLLLGTGRISLVVAVPTGALLLIGGFLLPAPLATGFLVQVGIMSALGLFWLLCLGAMVWLIPLPALRFLRPGSPRLIK